MKKWYRSILAKAVLIGIAVLSAVTLSLSAILLEGNQGEGTYSFGNLSGFRAVEYADSPAFTDRMQEVSVNILEEIRAGNQLENDEGVYDGGRLTDIMEYMDKGTISGKNIHGIAYTLDQLQSWGHQGVSSPSGEGMIVVCQKEDGTYYYYYMDEFRRLLREGRIQVELPDTGEGDSEETETSNAVIQALEEGWDLAGYFGSGGQITDLEQKEVYTNCWQFTNGSILEAEAPDGAENILEVVNETPELNGRLADVFSALSFTIQDITSQIDLYEQNDETWKEGNTNLTYLYMNRDDKEVYTNNSAYSDYAKADAGLTALKESGKYVIVRPKLADFESNLDVYANDWRELVHQYCDADSDYVFAVAVDTAYPVQDIFYTCAQAYEQYAPYLRYAGMLIVLNAVLLVITMVWLTVVAGRQPEDEELHLNAFDRWKTGLGAAAAIVPWFLMSWFVGTSWSGVGYQAVTYSGSQGEHQLSYYVFTMTTVDVLLIGGYVSLTMLLFFLGYLSLVRRIKGKTLWENSVLLWVYRQFRAFWRHRNLCLRTVLLTGGILFAHWLALLFRDNGFFVLLILALDVLVLYLMLRTTIEKDKIRKGILEIAGGNVNYQIPMEKLHGESREMAELINGIGDGMNRAVDAAMKSERLKTDLITNVSHDIKTPLTSIINYVDLLKRENLEDPKIQGYLEILETKAQRLKTLTEDVVEASKVSSGNITLEFMDVNLVEMVNQTIGEFSEKMEAKNLTIVAALPEEPATVHVDGRRMWRVLENIFNNAAKYAMPGTRVYADLRVDDGKVTFSLKNVSENPLNISAEELTERFIRGDVSRSTEGSGLGLSIARDLTEMQGGKFTLYVDGDLFKVVIECSRVV